MTRRKRSGSYRKSFFKASELEVFWNTFHSEVKSIQASWLNKKISSAELVAAVLLKIWQWSRPNSWSNGPYLNDIIFENILASESPLKTWQNLQLRGIPAGVNEILCYWHVHPELLNLTFDIPSPLDVLRLQCEGKRCVSLLIRNKESFLSGGDHRDSFSFALHDLIHAVHFFSNPEHKKQQVFIAKLMLEILSLELVKDTMLSNPVLEHELYYLASDMNTHWIHSLKCLKSALRRANLSLRFTANNNTFSLQENWDKLNTPAESEAMRIKFEETLYHIIDDLLFLSKKFPLNIEIRPLNPRPYSSRCLDL